MVQLMFGLISLLESVGLSCNSPSPKTNDMQGGGSPALSWTMKRFLEPATRVRNHLLLICHL